jgi:hypothetical protein
LQQLHNDALTNDTAAQINSLSEDAIKELLDSAAAADAALLKITTANPTDEKQSAKPSSSSSSVSSTSSSFLSVISEHRNQHDISIAHNNKAVARPGDYVESWTKDQSRFSPSFNSPPFSDKNTLPTEHHYLSPAQSNLPNKTATVTGTNPSTNLHISSPSSTTPSTSTEILLQGSTLHNSDRKSLQNPNLNNSTALDHTTRTDFLFL